MAVFKLLFFSTCLLTAAASPRPYSYNINSYLDEAVKEFNKNVSKAGDNYVVLNDTISIGGFALRGPMLADMSSLERVGNAWLVPSKNVVEVRAEFKFEKLHLDGWNLTGPGMNLDKPRISARSNLIEVIFQGHIQTNRVWARDDFDKGCFATYWSELTKISDVELVSGYNTTRLDPWIAGLFPQITELMNPLFYYIFERHFDLCESLKKYGYKL